MTPRSAAQPSIRRHIIAGVFVIAVLLVAICSLISNWIIERNQHLRNTRT